MVYLSIPDKFTVVFYKHNFKQKQFIKTSKEKKPLMLQGALTL
jgi:hypothetical protein